MEGIPYEISSHNIRVHRLFGQSLAFADNPTDAPLMPSDGNTTVAQQQNCAGHNRRHSNQKEEPGHQKPRMKILQSTTGTRNRAMLNT